MIIDGHQHVLRDVNEQIKINRNCNIDRVVLFPTIVHPEIAKTKEEFSKELNTLNQVLRGEINPVEARINSINELVSAINRSSGYFIGFGSCPFGWIMNKRPIGLISISSETILKESGR